MQSKNHHRGKGLINWKSQRMVKGEGTTRGQESRGTYDLRGAGLSSVLGSGRDEGAHGH